MRNKGFTLIELTISIVIIGLLLTSVIKGQALINQAHITSVIKIADDYSTAFKEFKTRYKLPPGDMPKPNLLINGISETCKDGGNGNSKVDGAAGDFANVPLESQCIPGVLSKAGMISTEQVIIDETTYPVVRSHYGNVWIKSVGSSRVFTAQGAGTFPILTQYVIEFDNLSCEAAQTIDRTIDNDNISSGKTAASVDNCAIGGANDPVPFFAIAI